MSRFLNHYTCPKCTAQWSDAWSCMVDDDCPGCGMRHISPDESDEIEDDGDLVDVIVTPKDIENPND